MSAKFKATIKSCDHGDSWEIELQDKEDGRIVICKNMDEFSIQVEDMGVQYGGDIEVSWDKDESLKHEHFLEIYAQMEKYK